MKVARTAAEITSTMKVRLKGNEAGLVAYFRMDEEQGARSSTARRPTLRAPGRGPPIRSSLRQAYLSSDLHRGAAPASTMASTSSSVRM